MYKPHAEIVVRNDLSYDPNPAIVVSVVWKGKKELDRPNVGGWVFSLSQRVLAERLVAAINSGVVFKNAKVAKDIYGKTYIQAEQTQFFHKQHMSRSLRAVGF